jgi:hypothetical protein
MAAKQKYSDEFLNEYFLKLENYKYLGEVKNDKKGRFIKVKHLLCGKEYDVSIDKFVKKEQRCSCSRKRKNALIKNTKDYNDYLEKKYLGEYKAIAEYLGRKKPIMIEHKCGYRYEIKRAEFLVDDSSGGKCPICSQGTHNNTEIINERFKRKGYNIKLMEVFTDVNNKHLVINNDCGHIYKISIDKALSLDDKNNHMNCPICGIHSKFINIERVKREIEEGKFDIEILSNEYNETHEPLDVKCKICGKEYKISRTNILSGKGCPHCNPQSSLLEKEVSNFVRENTKFKIEENKRWYSKNRSFQELDIYIPNLKIGIEFNGLYWHSDTYKNKNYHLDKTLSCKKLGIRLIHIFEDEWINKKDVVKSKLKHILNISDEEKVYARKTIIKEITNKEKTSFLEKYHIQGSDQATIKLGEYYNDELVAVMTFTKLRRSLGSKKSDPGQYELSRFATSKNVIGGFSKMLKYAINNYDISYIKTFADLRWSDFESNVYESNGFTLSHISAPNYFYVPNSGKIRYHRFNFRKNILEEKFPEYYDKNLTEFQIMDKTNYSRIWDCGNLVYEMHIKK